MVGQTYIPDRSVGAQWCTEAYGCKGTVVEGGQTYKAIREWGAWGLRCETSGLYTIQSNQQLC